MSSLQEQQREDEVMKSEQLRYEAAMERELQRMKREEYAQVVRRIRQIGGIRPYRNDVELEEWRALPRSVRTHKGFGGRKPQAADDVAATLAEEYPWLGIHDERGLFAYLTRRRK